EFHLTAVTLDANDQPVVVPDLNDATARVTSLTLRPVAALEYGRTYRLRADAAIIDTDRVDEGGPRALVPFEMTFTTFGPKALPQPSSGEPPVASPSLVVLGDRGYLAQPVLPANTTLHVFDISDPQNHIQLEGTGAAQGRPIDLA